MIKWLPTDEDEFIIETKNKSAQSSKCIILVEYIFKKFNWPFVKPLLRNQRV